MVGDIPYSLLLSNAWRPASIGAESWLFSPFFALKEFLFQLPGVVRGLLVIFCHLISLLRRTNNYFWRNLHQGHMQKDVSDRVHRMSKSSFFIRKWMRKSTMGHFGIEPCLWRPLWPFWSSWQLPALDIHVALLHILSFYLETNAMCHFSVQIVCIWDIRAKSFVREEPNYGDSHPLTFPLGPCSSNMEDYQTANDSVKYLAHTCTLSYQAPGIPHSDLNPTAHPRHQAHPALRTPQCWWQNGPVDP